MNPDYENGRYIPEVGDLVRYEHSRGNVELSVTRTEVKGGYTNIWLGGGPIPDPLFNVNHTTGNANTGRWTLIRRAELLPTPTMADVLHEMRTSGASSAKSRLWASQIEEATAPALEVVSGTDAAALPVGSLVTHTSYHEPLVPETGARVVCVDGGYNPPQAPRQVVVLVRADGPARSLRLGERVETVEALMARAIPGTIVEDSGDVPQTYRVPNFRVEKAHIEQRVHFPVVVRYVPEGGVQ